MQHTSHTIDRSHFPNRPQTISGNPIEILDASDFFEERSAYSSPDIDTIDASGLFAQDEVVIGIGRPNVFTLIPDGKGNHLRFAAKSLKRAPSKIEETKNRVQSSIFLILKDLSEEQISGVKQSGDMHEGSRNWTCVNENMKMLSDAGITLGNGKSLSGIYWPAEAFKKISRHGIQMNGDKIDIDILKTSRRYLESQVFQTRKSVAMTPFRHGKRWLVDRGFIKKENQSIRERKVDYPIAPKMEHREHHQTDIALIAANTPKIASLFRSFWGAHGILGIEQKRVDINTYLQDELQAYPQENPSFGTRLKKNILFNKRVVGFLNTFLQMGYTRFEGKSESDLHTLFETDSEIRPCKYNIIVSRDSAKLMKIDVENPTIDWILSKHVLISNYDESVRFAGEVWKDEEGTIWVNRNSGTYAPSKEQLDACIEYLRAIFPHVTFQADYTI